MGTATDLFTCVTWLSRRIVGVKGYISAPTQFGRHARESPPHDCEHRKRPSGGSRSSKASRGRARPRDVHDRDNLNTDGI